jgi:hypothetical protein
MKFHVIVQRFEVCVRTRPRHVRPSNLRPRHMRPRYVRPSHVRPWHVCPPHLNNEKNEVVDNYLLSWYCLSLVDRQAHVWDTAQNFLR